MEVSKNLRNNTATKILAATMPTNKAANHSMVSMMRSNPLLLDDDIQAV
jgi:hypothetical protein